MSNRKISESSTVYSLSNEIDVIKITNQRL